MLCLGTQPNNLLWESVFDSGCWWFSGKYFFLYVLMEGSKILITTKRDSIYEILIRKIIKKKILERSTKFHQVAEWIKIMNILGWAFSEINFKKDLFLKAFIFRAFIWKKYKFIEVIGISFRWVFYLIFYESLRKLSKSFLSFNFLENFKTIWISSFKNFISL